MHITRSILQYVALSFLMFSVGIERDQYHKVSSQLIFTCSKPTIETLEKGVKYVQSQQ